MFSKKEMDRRIGPVSFTLSLGVKTPSWWRITLARRMVWLTAKIVHGKWEVFASCDVDLS